MKRIFTLISAIAFGVQLNAQSSCVDMVYDQGEGTYYTLLDNGNIGNCTFENDSIKPYYGALATGMYNGDNGNYPAEFCGACVEVTGAAGTKIIQIVDQCPTCHLDQDIDLSPTAFEEIVGPLSTGRGDISWFEVPCPWGNKPVEVIIQGSNAWYGKVIIAAHKNRIKSVEIQNGSSWETMVRGEDNGWVKGSLGGFSSYKIRITDIFNEVIEVDNVDLSVGDGKVIGTTNFTPCITTTTNEINAKLISTYPNPINNTLTIAGIKGIETIAVYDMQGRLMTTHNVNTNLLTTQINTAHLATGMYQLVLTNSSGNQVTKSVVKK